MHKELQLNFKLSIATKQPFYLHTQKIPDTATVAVVYTICNKNCNVPTTSYDIHT